MKQNSENKDICNEAKLPFVDNAIFIYTRDEYRRIMYDEIMWIVASGSYCNLHLTDGSEITISYPLDHVVTYELPHSIFLRIHRSYAVNIFKVTKFIGNTAFVGKQMLPISGPNKKDFLACFHKIYSKRGLGE